jgi:hypothetical protein
LTAGKTKRGSFSDTNPFVWGPYIQEYDQFPAALLWQFHLSSLLQLEVLAFPQDSSPATAWHVFHHVVSVNSHSSFINTTPTFH